MSEFEVNGIQYRCGKLDAFKQFHVARRLTPIFATLKDLKFKDGKLDLEGTDMTPLANALSNLKDEDADFIINTALTVVQRKQGDQWMRVRANGVTMFEGMDMMQLLQITWNVLADTFSSFLAEAPRPTMDGGAGSQPA